MRLLYPVPVSIIPKKFLLEEHLNCISIASQIHSVNAGEAKLEDLDPEVGRWFGCQSALYDRYQKTIDMLSKTYQVEVINTWPLEVGGLKVFPKYTFGEVVENLSIVGFGAKVFK